MSTLYQLPKIIYNGNGEQTGFDFSFPAKSSIEVEVWVSLKSTGFEGALRLNEDFRFSTVPTENNGGTIVYPIKDDVPVLGPEDKICIMRKSKLGNDYIFSNQTRLLPQTVEDADDSLSLQIMDLARDLSMAVKASPFDDRTPEERWNEITVELKKAQEIINYINSEYLSLPELLQEEREERERSDENLWDKIEFHIANTSADMVHLSQEISDEAAARKQADELLIKKEIVPEAVTSIDGRFSASSVGLSVSKKDTSTGSVSESFITLPVASELQHGVMPKEAYSSLSDLTTRVSYLEGGQAKTYPLNLGVGPFAQEDYQLAWENAAGVAPGSVPPDGTKIVNLDTNIEIQYFSTQGEWTEREATVPLATLTSVGVVKGASENGKIAVEPDGSMSLVGYDDIVAKGSSNASLVSGEIERAKAAESSINQDLQSHKSDTVIHVSEAERTAWNKKYTKPDSGIPSSDFAGNVQSVLNDVVTKTGGGTIGGKLVARTTTDASPEVRNITFTNTDPGVGSALASGSIIMVYE